MQTYSTVDWKAYAKNYDMLLHYNPFYQDLQSKVIQILKDWQIQIDDQLIDLGAGTGNYSIEMAKLFPQARILHIDNNEGMNAIAQQKAIGLRNLEILNQGIEATKFDANTIAGLVSINALYTFPNPEKVLETIYQWLVPGAKVVLVDPGRIMNLFSWRFAIGKHLVKTYGIGKTLEIFNKAKAVGQQNRYIRKMQKEGVFWTHSHEEFVDTVQEIGFEVEHQEICFKGDCDLVVARKPE